MRPLDVCVRRFSIFFAYFFFAMPSSSRLPNTITQKMFIYLQNTWLDTWTKLWQYILTPVLTDEQIIAYFRITRRNKCGVKTIINSYEAPIYWYILTWMSTTTAEHSVCRVPTACNVIAVIWSLVFNELIMENRRQKSECVKVTNIFVLFLLCLVAFIVFYSVRTDKRWSFV